MTTSVIVQRMPLTQRSHHARPVPRGRGLPCPDAGPQHGGVRWQSSGQDCHPFSVVHGWPEGPRSTTTTRFATGGFTNEFESAKLGDPPAIRLDKRGDESDNGMLTFHPADTDLDRIRLDKAITQTKLENPQEQPRQVWGPSRTADTSCG